MDGLGFLEGKASEVAQRLLGCILQRQINGHTIRVKIVETEAYDETDAASHSYKGKTPRTSIMFGPPGHLYVYFTYGMHYCCNIVTGPTGVGSAVLIRAVEPIEGIEFMRHLRDKDMPEISNGPAKLCQALGIDKNLNGHDLSKLPLKLIAQPPINPKFIAKSKRIGIRESKELLWRFYIKENLFVSSILIPKKKLKNEDDEITIADVIILAMPFADSLVSWCNLHPDFKEALKFSNHIGFLPLGVIFTSTPSLFPNDEVIGFLVYDMQKGIFKQDYIVNINKQYKCFKLYTKLPNKKYSRNVTHIKNFFSLYGANGDYKDTHHYSITQIEKMGRPDLLERARDTIDLAYKIKLRGRYTPTQQELIEAASKIKAALNK
jgi:DNA-3-methyladenine glycosylase